MRRDAITRRFIRSASLAGCLAGLTALACQRTEAPHSEAPASSTAPAAATTEPVGVDAQDDPQAPRALPESNDLPGWIKTRPIRVAGPGQFKSLLADPALLEAAGTFRVGRVAACTYESPPARAEALLFEMGSPEDAFGLFSVITRQPGLRVRPEDGMMIERRQAADALTVTGWQGKHCLVVSVSGSTADAQQRRADWLARRILFGLPSADPPFILRAIPPVMLADGKVWMVRKTEALRHTALPALARVAAADLDEVLGLTGSEKLWIAAVGKRATELESSVTPASGPADTPSTAHLVWIVQYAGDGPARQAYQRYQQVLASPGTDLDRQTILREPRGPYLAGSWTAAAESADPLLPALMDILPAAGVADSSLNHAGRRPATRPSTAAP
jgi:hypothetical protein